MPGKLVYVKKCRYFSSRSLVLKLLSFLSFLDNFCISKMLTLTFICSVIAIVANALDLDPTSKSSICKNAALIVNGTLDYYEGTKYGGTVGMFAQPYYWWQAGEAFGSLLNYQYYCASEQDKDIGENVENLIYDGITSQLGENFDLMVANISSSEGNDDQAVWGLTIMNAAEAKYPQPTKNGNITWGEIGINVLNSMFSRWDDTCGGGIRWQIFNTNNNGFTYKNSISNGGLFTLAARLARYYSNNRYAYLADFVWQWSQQVGFMIESDDGILIYDGGNIDQDCKDITNKHWSYNYGMYLLGASYLYNYTSDEKWLQNVEKILATSTELFTNDNDIIYESQCQNSTLITCNNDQRSFKAVFIRSLATTSVLVPQVKEKIDKILLASAKAAAKSCSGGSDGHTCGLSWLNNKWDGLYGFGEQLNALEAIQSLLAGKVSAPATAKS